MPQNYTTRVRRRKKEYLRCYISKATYQVGDVDILLVHTTITGQALPVFQYSIWFDFTKNGQNAKKKVQNRKKLTFPEVADLVRKSFKIAKCS